MTSDISPPVVSPLAERVDRLRRQRGLTRDALEKRAGLGKGYVSRLLRGQRGDEVQLATVERLAGALGVDPLWLATGSAPSTVSELPAGLAQATAAAPGRWPAHLVAQAALVPHADSASSDAWADYLDGLAREERILVRSAR